MPEFTLPRNHAIILSLNHARTDAKMFALHGLDLLSDLPAYFNPDISHAAVLYKNPVQSEVASINYKDGKFAVKAITYKHAVYDSE